MCDLSLPIVKTSEKNYNSTEDVSIPAHKTSGLKPFLHTQNRANKEKYFD